MLDSASHARRTPRRWSRRRSYFAAIAGCVTLLLATLAVVARLTPGVWSVSLPLVSSITLVAAGGDAGIVRYNVRAAPVEAAERSAAIEELVAVHADQLRGIASSPVPAREPSLRKRLFGKRTISKGGTVVESQCIVVPTVPLTVASAALFSCTLGWGRRRQVLLATCEFVPGCASARRSTLRVVLEGTLCLSLLAVLATNLRSVRNAVTEFGLPEPQTERIGPPRPRGGQPTVTKTYWLERGRLVFTEAWFNQVSPAWGSFDLGVVSQETGALARVGGSTRRLTIDLDLLAILIALPLLFLFWKGPWRRAGRRLRGECIACGYDLQGTESDRCPECGVPIPAGQKATREDAPAS